jgi:hypothetical protein
MRAGDLRRAIGEANGPIQHMRTWTQRYSTTILLATHSPVIIDTFREYPEQVYVMEHGDHALPISLSSLKDPEWLAHFSPGDLYTREDLEHRGDPDEDRPHHDR